MKIADYGKAITSYIQAPTREQKELSKLRAEETNRTFLADGTPPPRKPKELKDNSLPTTSSQSPLTAENQRSIIATSSADTSERTTMMQPDEEKLFNHVRDWAIGRVQEFNGQDITQIYDQLALIDD